MESDTNTPPATDAELLARLRGTGSHAAFAAIVRRHVDLVYSTALRRVRIPQLAEDVTQAVFLALLQKGPGLPAGTVLAGWLYQTSRYLSADVLKMERRRKHYERRVAAQPPSEPIDDQTWTEISPMLESAMDRLAEPDRDVILLRYFVGMEVAAVAEATGIPANTAAKRIGRALEKLRQYFSDRGISAPADAVGAAISTGAVQPAPAHLASIAAQAVATSPAIAALARGAARRMPMVLKAAIGMSVAAAWIIGGLYLFDRAALTPWRKPGAPSATASTAPMLAGPLEPVSPQQSQQIRAAIPATQPTVSGRVLDAAGRPVSDATVFASTDVLGENLGHAMPEILKTQTDAQGRYSLRLPYGGLLYFINGLEMVVNTDQQVDLHLEDSPKGDGRLTGHLHTAADQPAIGVALSLVGEYGGTFPATTDASGAFTFTGLPQYFGQGAILAKTAGDAVPLIMVNEDNLHTPLDLKLIAPAKFHGNVDDEVDGKPIAGVTVTISPSEFASGVHFTTTTDVKGNWQFDSIPPGSYAVDLESPAYFFHPPRDDGGREPRYRIRPGENAMQDFGMQRDAHVRGTVVDSAGKPVAGAMACTLVTWNGDSRNQYRWAVTDAQGRFDLATGHVGEELFLQVGHGRFGYVERVTIQPLGPSGKSPDLRIVLPGTVHMTGTIHGPRGEPIPDVTCRADWLAVSVQSDAQGRFDLGWISAPDPRGATVTALPPTIAPSPNVTFAGGPTAVPPAEAENRTFYQTASKPFTAAPGQAVSVAIGLKEDQVLLIHGQLVDLDGRALAGATAYLFPGTPDDGWIKLASGVVDDNINTVDDVAECVTDANGNFSLPVLRSTGEPAGKHGMRYALGIASAAKAHKLITDVIVAPDKHDLELKITVDPTVELKRRGE